MPKRPSPRGFTLIEMMVVVALASLLLCAAVPAFQALLQARRLAHATDAFQHGIYLTRVLALRHGSNASMQPLDKRNWANGWRIVDGQQQLIMQQPALPAGITVRHKSNGLKIAFDASGRPVTPSTWTFGSDGHWRNVVINFLGRVRQCRPQTPGQSC